MAEKLHTTLTFVWDGDNGRVDRASLRRLMEEDGAVILDFLADIRDEADCLYNNAAENGVLWKRAG